MCLEDFRISRRTYSGSFVVTIGETLSQLLPADSDRTAVILSSHPTIGYFWLNDQSVDNSAGIYVPPASLPMKLTLLADGDVVRKPFYAAALSEDSFGMSGNLTPLETPFVIGSGGTIPIGVIVTSLAER